MEAAAILPDAIREPQRYSWPGNVRELRNVVERLMLLAEGPVDAAAVRIVHYAKPITRSGNEGAAAASPWCASKARLRSGVDAFEREQIPGGTGNGTTNG